MAKGRKELKKIKNGRIPGEVPLRTVNRILKLHFSGEQIKPKKSSHIVIHDDRLRDYSDSEDSVTIPIKGGNKVKRYYIKYKLIPLIDFMDELEK